MSYQHTQMDEENEGYKYNNSFKPKISYETQFTYHEQPKIFSDP